MTVTDIITASQINRSTFYAYYLDKYDLLDQLENQTLADLQEILQIDQTLLPKQLEKADLTPFLVLHADRLTNFIYQQGEQISLFLKTNESQFLDKLGQVLPQTWSEVLGERQLKIPSHYLLAAVSSLMMGLIREWVKRDYQESKAEFSYILLTLFQDMIPHLVEEG